MIPRIKPWAKTPTDWIKDGRIVDLSFRTKGSTGTAALILFFALCQSAEEVLVGEEGFPDRDYIATLTYDEMGELASLSRAKISGGLTLLEEYTMVSRQGLNRAGRFKIEGLKTGTRWAKLPGRELLSSTKRVFAPFARFTLRSKHELNALKLYFYYASVRDNALPYSEAAYSTIHEKTGVSERDIPAANSLLLATELMHRVSRVEDSSLGHHGANQYFLSGYKQFFIRPTP